MTNNFGITTLNDQQNLGLLRLRTLVRLRWLAVIGQSAAVIGVNYILGYKLPVALCLAMIALSAWLNIFLSLRWRGGQRLAARPAGLRSLLRRRQPAPMVQRPGRRQRSSRQGVQAVLDGEVPDKT